MTVLPFTVLVPAYKPVRDLPEIVATLLARGAAHVVVVDDGSGPEYSALFGILARMDRVTICRHALNLGKGAALKTGINAILCEDAETAIVTADADGQHLPDDILLVAQSARQHPSDLVLGVRVFSPSVPFRSRAGNRATRLIMRLVTGQKLSDTQTGLRAIPSRLAPFLLKLQSQGYEFELDMLLQCRTRGVRIREVPIHTVYLNGNASSHFNPLFDSMRIYFVLLRFALISLCTAILDNLIFSAFFLRTGNILTSQLIGRSVAMVFNFLCVRRMVFHARSRVWREFLGYALLVALSGACSYGLISLLTARLSMGVLQAKLLAEGMLFIVNFLVQRDVIFTHSPDAETPTNTDL